MKTTSPQHRLVALLSLPIFLFLVIPTAIVVPVALTTAGTSPFPPEGLSFAAVAGFFADKAWTSALRQPPIGRYRRRHRSRARRDRGHRHARAQVHGPARCGGADPGADDRAHCGAGTRVLPVLHIRRDGGSILPIGLAHAVIATPYVYLTTRASLAGLNPALVRSAQSLGAGPLSVFATSICRSSCPGLISGALFAFSVSIDETVMSLFMQSPGATTLPVKMFTDIQFNLTPKIAVSSALLVSVATFGLLLQVMFVLRRRSTARMLPLAAPAQT